MFCVLFFLSFLSGWLAYKTIFFLTKNLIREDQVLFMLRSDLVLKQLAVGKVLNDCSLLLVACSFHQFHLNNSSLIS